MNTKYHELPNGFKIVTKKLFTLILGFSILTSNLTLVAQTNPEPTSTSAADSVPAVNDSTAESTEVAAVPTETKAEKPSGHQVIKDKFIEGDPIWMAPVLICFLIGLAIVIERIISLFLMGINTQKFVERIENILKTKGVEAAKEECRNTKGPIASIYFQGLDRVDEGIDKVESAVQSYGSVQMGQLEKGMVWISLFIALAPMLGFLGTVVGMIFAFDMIAAAGDISPTIVASGIKVALLTTVAGLIVAIILQVFYNLILSKIDSIANEMEDASISLTDMLIKNKIAK
jgi:biopolymer transport protein ExbB